MLAKALCQQEQHDNRHARRQAAPPCLCRLLAAPSNSTLSEPNARIAAGGKGGSVPPFVTDESSALRVSVVSSFGMFPTYSLCLDCEGATRSCNAHHEPQTAAAASLQDPAYRAEVVARRHGKDVLLGSPVIALLEGYPGGEEAMLGEALRPAGRESHGQQAAQGSILPPGRGSLPSASRPASAAPHLLPPASCTL